MKKFLKHNKLPWLILVVILLLGLIVVLWHTDRPAENLIEGRVLENASQVTSRGIEYSARIEVTDKIGKKRWIWVTIPARDAIKLPYGSTLIVDLNAERR